MEQAGLSGHCLSAVALLGALEALEALEAGMRIWAEGKCHRTSNWLNHWIGFLGKISGSAWMRLRSCLLVPTFEDMGHL